MLIFWRCIYIYIIITIIINIIVIIIIYYYCYYFLFIYYYLFIIIIIVVIIIVIIYLYYYYIYFIIIVIVIVVIIIIYIYPRKHREYMEYTISFGIPSSTMVFLCNPFWTSHKLPGSSQSFVPLCYGKFGWPELLRQLTGPSTVRVWFDDVKRMLSDQSLLSLNHPDFCWPIVQSLMDNFNMPGWISVCVVQTIIKLKCCRLNLQW